MKSFDDWKKENVDSNYEDDVKAFGIDSENDIEEPINDDKKECNEITDPLKEDTLDFTTWVNTTECFGQNDLNDIRYVYKKLKDEYDYLFDDDWDAEFDIQEDKDGGIFITIKGGEEGKEKLVDILRNFWEDEMNEEDNDTVEEVTIEMLGL